MKHPAPRPGRDATQFWLHARQSRLAIPHCPHCGTYEWPPRARCSKCGGEAEWREVSGRGRIFSYSVVERAVNPDMADEVPYAVAIVELDEGVRLLSNIVDCNPDGLSCGQEVAVRFEPTADPDMWAPVFAPIRKG